VLLGAVVVCFWPLFKHPGWLLVGFQHEGSNDLNWIFLTRRMVPQLVWSKYGQLPFWCPWWSGGSPLLGNLQAAIFYPFNWPFWILDVTATISWSLVFHHLVGAVGAYRLSRKLGGAPLGSSFAAVAFGFSPILLAHTSEGHLANISVVSWYPWAFSMYEGFRVGNRQSAVGLVLTLGLATLAGHPQEACYLILALTTVLIYEVFRSALDGAIVRAWRLIGGWALVGIATAGLVAAELIPMTTYLGQSAQAARLTSGAEGTPGLANLLQLLHPFALGGPTDYTGPGIHYWETICHFGLVALGLAVTGVITSIGEKRPIGRLAGVGAGSFLLAFGQRIPVLGTLTDYVPGFAMMRCPGRWLMLTSMSIAILAGFGLDSVAAARWGLGIARQKMASRAGLVLTIVLASITTLGVLGLVLDAGKSSSGQRPAVRLDTPRVLSYPLPWLVFGGALGCAALALFWPRRAVFFAAMTIPLGLSESAVFANSIFMTRPPGAFSTGNAAVVRLADRAKGWRVFCKQVVISDLQSLEAGLLKVQHYEAVPLERPLTAFTVALSAKTPIDELIGFLPVDLSHASDQLFNLWAVKYILIQSHQPLGPSRATGWRLVWTVQVPSQPEPGLTDPGRFWCQVWENSEALPRGFVVGRARVPRPGEPLQDALKQLSPRSEVLLDRDDLPPGPRQEYTPARRIEDTPNRVTLEVETIHPGYLVLADTWYPGWTATVDGQTVPVRPANIAFRAVALSQPGRHRVTFRYYPVGLNLGCLFSVATLTGLAVTFLREQWPRKAARCG
jgi:hypothetical protein